jgi:hypothetical protein
MRSASPGRESLRDCPGRQCPDSRAGAEAGGVPDRHLASPDQALSVTQGEAEHTAGRPCPDSEARGKLAQF